jgi:hypothetical protein
MILPEEGDVYVKCGADILINGLKTDLRAEARCPSCGNITPFPHTQWAGRRSCSQRPKLHVVELKSGQGHLSIECKSTHIFDKKDCLTKWLSTYTGRPGLITSLPEYMGSLNQRPPKTVSPT